MGVIASQASGFIYYVALKGVTGAGNLDVADVTEKLALIRGHTDLPLAVGFGIKDAESARSIATVADGVVVGSALVNVLAQAADNGDSQEDTIVAATALLADIRQGIDSITS